MTETILIFGEPMDKAGCIADCPDLLTTSESNGVPACGLRLCFS